MRPCVKKKKFVGMAVFMVLSFVVAGQAPALTILPDPTQLYDGIPVASPHDDFWSYSGHIMTALIDEGYLPLPDGSFDFATGSGGLDVLLYTGAGGQSNQGVGPGDAFNFEDPVYNHGGSDDSFDGWWGQDDQNNDGTPDSVNGPVTVGQVLDYLHAFNPFNNIPVLYMDLNQNGSESSLFFNGQVYLTDGTDIAHAWAFDNTPQPYPNGFLSDGDFDPFSLVPAPGEVTITGDSNTVYSVNHNLGSGKPDFIAFAPSMDLSLYDENLWFVTEFHFDGLNDGFEEIFLTGTITPPGVPPIPEPATMLLLGSGLIGLAVLGRKKAGERKNNY